MVWYSSVLKSFPQFAVIPTVRGFGAVAEAEVGVFMEPLALSMVQPESL